MNLINTITKHLPGWPPGSPDGIQAAAAVWRDVAGELTTVLSETERRVESLAATWQGPGAEAFRVEWSRLATATREASGHMEALAGELSQAADQLRTAQERYKEIEGAAAVTVVIGAVFTVISCGASDVAAAAEVEGEAVAATAEADAAVSLATRVLQKAEEMAIEAAKNAVVFSGIDLVAQGAISTLVFPDHNPFGHLDFRVALGAGIGDAAPEVGVGGLAARAGAQAVAEGTFDAAGQAVGTGHVDLAQAAGAGLVSGGEGLLPHPPAAGPDA